jgi:uncharacterized protein YndB with AHSA1/START domain
MTPDKTMTLRVRTAAPQAAVWQALTDVDQLQTWLAEHAEVDLPQRFAFWGRYTPEGDAPHQRLVSSDERSLRFTWLLDGIDSSVEIRLDPDGPTSTIISVSQSDFDFQEALAERSSLGLMQTFWALSLGNLVDHLEGRGVAYRCDFTSAEMRAALEINAPRRRIYEALTDSDQASAWFGFPIGIEPYVGGRFAMGGLDVGPAATVVEAVDGRKMSVDWGDTGIGTWELEGSGGKTRLTFVQSGFSTPRPPYGAWLGTVAGFLSLRRYVEQADWQSIYLTGDPDADAVKVIAALNAEAKLA